jgi:uncharacterized phage-associated protein
MSDYIHDVAAYFVAAAGPRGISSMKLHKLLYVADTVYRRQTSESLFDETFTVSESGPVIPDLFPFHEGAYSITSWKWGDPNAVLFPINQFLDSIDQKYSALSGPMLSELVKKFPEYTQVAAADALAKRDQQAVTFRLQGHGEIIVEGRVEGTGSFVLGASFMGTLQSPEDETMTVVVFAEGSNGNRGWNVWNAGTFPFTMNRGKRADGTTGVVSMTVQVPTGTTFKVDGNDDNTDF